MLLGDSVSKVSFCLLEEICFSLSEVMKEVFYFCCHALMFISISSALRLMKGELSCLHVLSFFPSFHLRPVDPSKPSSHCLIPHLPSLKMSFFSLSFRYHNIFFFNYPDQPVTFLLQRYRRNSCGLFTVLYFYFCFI